MAESTTDPLERAVLSGALFAGRDPEGEDPIRAESSDDGRSANGSQHDEDEGLGFVHPSDLPSGSGTGDMARTGSSGRSHNTGVKGVLADYREEQAAKLSAASKGLRAVQLAQATSSSLSDDGSDGLLSDGEEEARLAYRKKRMEELMKMGSSERSGILSANGKGSHKRAKFGHLREVGHTQFVKAIEEDNPDTTVLVHVYDPMIPLCNVLNAHLSSLARKYPHTKFIRSLAEALDFAAGSEEDVLPTLLVYRNRGENVRSLVALEREIRDELLLEEDDELDEGKVTRQLVEELLVKHGVVDYTSAVSLSSSGDDGDSE